MYVIKNMKNKQKEWHPATKPLKFSPSVPGPSCGDFKVAINLTIAGL
jgi:hypothetical protein